MTFIYQMGNLLQQGRFLLPKLVLDDFREFSGELILAL